METTAGMPEILIPAAPELAGAGSASVEIPATTPSRDAAAGPAQAGKDSDFSNTFRDLQASAPAAEDPANAPPKAVPAPEIKPVAIPAEADTRLRIANLVPPAGLPDSESDLAAATASGKLLPQAGDTLPELHAAEAETPTPAPPGPVPADTNPAVARTPVPAASLTALAEARSGMPAHAPLSAAEIAPTTVGTVSVIPGYANRPANLTQITKTDSASAKETPLPPLEPGPVDLKPATDAPAQSLRSILMQPPAMDSPRIALPQLADAGLTAPISQGPANTAAAFTNTLAELSSPTSQPPLQPTGDRQVFTQGLGERLMLMADNGVQAARIKLYPEHLGPLDIKVQVEDDVAKVWFYAQHGQTREALEQALPRLREMFAEQGLQLVRSDVGEQGEDFGRQLGQSEGNQGREPACDHHEIETDLPATLMASMRIGGARLLDVRA